MLGIKNVRLAIIGNKVDLLEAPNEARAIQMSAVIREAIQMTEELQNARHYLTSAKLNHGLGELFVSLARLMIEQHKRLAGLRPQLAGSHFNLRASVALPGGPPGEGRDERKPISNNNNNSCRC